MRFLAILAALCVLAPSAAVAAEDTELAAALVDLEAALEREPNLSPEFKKALSAVVGALQADAAPTAAAVAQGKPGFWDRVSPFINMRLRHEWDGRRGSENRDRERVRLRVGANVTLDEEWSGGFRIRTGDPGDAQSPYHDLGRSSSREMFGSWELNIDRAFLRYRPPFLDASWITAGKFGHPFASNPIFGELVWDDDVSPEGIAAGYRFSPDADVSVDLTVGQYLLVANNSDSEVGAFVAQAAARVKVSDQTNAMLALGWYRYSNIDDPGAVLHDAGNLLVGGEFVSDFRIVNPILSLSYTGFGVPLTLSGEYILNTGAKGAAADRDEGFAVGVSVGQTQAPGDWQAYYQWQRIQQDAVFSAFAQDDFQQVTNFRGHVFGIRHKLTERIGLRAWGLISRPERTAGGPDEDGARLRFDVDAGF